MPRLRFAIAALLLLLLPRPSFGQEVPYDALLRELVYSRLGVASNNSAGVRFFATDSATMRLLGQNDSLRVVRPPAAKTLDCPRSDRAGEGGYIITAVDSALGSTGVRRVTITLACTGWYVIRGTTRAGYWTSGAWDVAKGAGGWRVVQELWRRVT